MSRCHLLMLVALNGRSSPSSYSNAINEIFGSGTAEDVVYVVVGVAALTFIPKLMEISCTSPGTAFTAARSPKRAPYQPESSRLVRLDSRPPGCPGSEYLAGFAGH